MKMTIIELAEIYNGLHNSWEILKSDKLEIIIRNKSTNIHYMILNQLMINGDIDPEYIKLNPLEGHSITLSEGQLDRCNVEEEEWEGWELVRQNDGEFDSEKGAILNCSFKLYYSSVFMGEGNSSNYTYRGDTEFNEPINFKI